jgi:2'-5' RNA ligase
MSVHRLFVALALPDQTKKLITEFQANLQTDIKWIPIDNLHITLAFIGATTTERISVINSVLEKVSNSSPHFNLKTKSIKVVKGTSGMIWVTFDENQPYTDLAISIREKLKLNEKRKPLPHINLARLKKPIQRENLPQDPRFGEHTIPCTQIELWESELSHTGAEYKVISTFPLK